MISLTVGSLPMLEDNMQDFPDGPVVKKLSPNAGDVGSIPGWGTEIPHD